MNRCQCGARLDAPAEEHWDGPPPIPDHVLKLRADRERLEPLEAAIERLHETAVNNTYLWTKAHFQEISDDCNLLRKALGFEPVAYDNPGR